MLPEVSKFVPLQGSYKTKFWHVLLISPPKAALDTWTGSEFAFKGNATGPSQGNTAVAAT